MFDATARLASSFEFVAPVVGPLSKDELHTALSGFDLMEGFPDGNFQYYFFRVDPFQVVPRGYTSSLIPLHLNVSRLSLEPLKLSQLDTIKIHEFSCWVRTWPCTSSLFPFSASRLNLSRFEKSLAGIPNLIPRSRSS